MVACIKNKPIERRLRHLWCSLFMKGCPTLWMDLTTIPCEPMPTGSRVVGEGGIQNGTGPKLECHLGLGTALQRLAQWPHSTGRFLLGRRAFLYGICLLCCIFTSSSNCSKTVRSHCLQLWLCECVCVCPSLYISPLMKLYLSRGGADLLYICILGLSR